jgi:hypothetical protein
MASKMSWRSSSGIKGLKWPVETSKKKTDPFTSQAQKWREGDLLAWNMLEKDI